MSIDSLTDMTNFEEQYSLADEEPSEELRAKREKFLLTRTLPVENSEEQPELVPRTQATTAMPQTSDSPLPSSSNGTPVDASEPGTIKSTKKVHFGKVHVFYFRRKQAYSVVPTSEGASLGMENEHHDAKKYTFNGFTRARYRENEHKWNQIKMYIDEQRKIPTSVGVRRSPRRNVTFAPNLTTTKPPSIESESGPTEADVIFDIVKHMVDAVSAGIEKIESSDDEDEVLPINNTLYLIPLEKHIRHALLSTADVQPDVTDFADCKDIRDSRGKCGCSCTDGICDPLTCECAINGIKCQVDQNGFPCPCDELNCANKEGRVEFSTTRVRTHFLSMMKILKDTEKSKFEPSSSLPRHIKFVDSDDESGTSTSYCATPPPPIYKTRKPDFVKSLSSDECNVTSENPVIDARSPGLPHENCVTAESFLKDELIEDNSKRKKRKLPVTPVYRKERTASISDFETPAKKPYDNESNVVSILEESRNEFVFPSMPSLLATPLKSAVKASPKKMPQSTTPTTSIVVVGNVLQSPQKSPKPTMPSARSVALNFSKTIEEDSESLL